MTFLKFILFFTVSATSFAQAAYDGSRAHGFTVCSNSADDFAVINLRSGVVTFHNPAIYDQLTILGSDLYGNDDGGEEETVEYYVFNENQKVFKVVGLRDGGANGRIEANFSNSKVLKSYSSCIWKAKL